MKKRTETANNAAIPGDTTISGLRRLSLSSIALLQMTNNPYLAVLVDGEPDPKDRLEELKFLYLHAAPVETVTRVALAARRDPDVLTAAALSWGADITPEIAEALIRDMYEDRDDITNSSFEVIPDGEKTTSKNLLGHQL